MKPAPDDVIGVIERSRLAVDIFFILSGFVLTHVYARQRSDGLYSHGRFLMARLARIYPAHLAMLLLMLGLVGGAMAVGDRFGETGYRVGGFLSAATMTHAWFPVALSNEWNGPSWSLSAEWAAYLAFPLFAAMGWRLRARPWITILAAVAIGLGLNALYLAMYGKILTQAENQMGVLRIIPTFLLGVGLYHLGARLTPTRAQARWASLVSGAALLASMQVQADELLIVGVSAALVLSLALLSKGGDEGVLAHPLMREAGEASYALYLVHFPLLIIWKNTFGLIGGVGSNYPLPLWQAAILLPIMIGGALVLHRYWERPARAWINQTLTRRLSRPSSSPPPRDGT
jgi:peptidoglycan/LPS O-acetylase OafA/YrhL